VDPVDAVAQCGGAARWARLSRRVPRRALASAVSAGELLSPGPGLYVLPGCPADVLAAAAVSGVRSCHSAAQALGLDLIGPPRRPHVTTRRGSRTTWPGAEVHHRDVVDLDGLTDPLTTVLDCLRCLPRRVALVPLDCALRRGLVSLEDLSVAAKSWNRRDPRRNLLRWADPDCGSALETVARVDLAGEGYALQTQQVREPAGRVDFLVDGWLVVEVDGFAFHADRVQFAEDRRRDAELARRGFVVLRFTFEQVLNRREWWLGVVRDVHERGRPGPFLRG
jgi:very-short-patch-repair endonuclease